MMTPFQTFAHPMRMLGLVLAAVLLQPFATANADHPNVIVILTDDQGSVDANSYGATDLTTPHMDALADRGVRFTQFYAGAPVCSPSRAALLTGRYPLRAGLPSNASSRQGHGGRLPSSEVTMAEVFADAGYATGHVGKWHVGYTEETMPNAQGFDYSFGHMGGCIDNYSHFFYWNGPNRHDLWENGEEVWMPGEFFPDLMVEKANRFIRRNQDRPFYLYLPFNIPHYPLQGTPKWRKHYADLPAPRRMYAALISTLDERIGRVLAEVRDLGLEEDTIVVFQSDHGHSTETRTFGGGGSAGPYRGAKFSLFEGGIRVPAIISWPGHLPEGEVRDQMAVSQDWLPTLAKLCDLSLPDRTIDGEDITSVIKSDTARSPHSTFFWGRDGNNAQWAVRQGNWKLIGNPRDTSNTAPLDDDDELFLVNLKEDIGELTNLRSQYPDKVQSLKNLYEQWVREATEKR